MLNLKMAALPILCAALCLSCKKETTMPLPSEPSNVSVVPVAPAITPPTYSQIAADSAAKATFLYDTKTPAFLMSTRTWQGCPTIGMENGHMFAAWFTGDKYEAPGNYITVSESDDMGKTWKSDVLTVAPDVVTNRQIDPSLWSDKYGYLHLSWIKSIGAWDGAAGGVWDILLKYENNKVSITKPRRLFPGCMNVKPTLLKSGTDIIFPESGWDVGTVFNNFPSTATPSELNGPFIWKSSYNESTQTITQPIQIARIPAPIKSRANDEHMILELDGKNLVAMMRAYGGAFSSTSTDGGVNWSVPTKFTTLGTISESRMYFARLKSGNVIFVCNNDASRTNLTAFLSKDNGKTFPYKLLLDTREYVSYPDVIQDKDGNIYFMI